MPQRVVVVVTDELCSNLRVNDVNPLTLKPDTLSGLYLDQDLGLDNEATRIKPFLKKLDYPQDVYECRLIGVPKLPNKCCRQARSLPHSPAISETLHGR